MRLLILLTAMLGATLAPPARAINVHRSEVKGFIKHMAKDYRFDGRAVRKLLRAAQEQPAILEAMERPAEKAKVQATNDFLVFGMMATGALTSGAFFNSVGWNALNYVAAPFLAVALIAVVWLALKRRPAVA